MNKHILFLFLFSFSTSAFALFPIENDWAKHHLQGKVKSIKSKEEGNSALPDNGSVSYLDAFYNEQGFLIKEKEQGVLFDKEKITIRHYKYDAQNRLLEIQDDNVTETNPELKTFSAFYRYVDNPDGSGVVQFVEYKDTLDFSSSYKEHFYDKAGTLLKTQEYDVENKTTSDIKKYDYENGKLSKICRIEDNVERDCDTYHYENDGSFIESLNVFINSVKNYFDKNHRLLKSEIFSVGKRINWATVSYQFDKHGNVIEEIIYNKDGVWKTKKTYQYEYYE